MAMSDYSIDVLKLLSEDEGQYLSEQEKLIKLISDNHNDSEYFDYDTCTDTIQKNRMVSRITQSMLQALKSVSPERYNTVVDSVY